MEYNRLAGSAYGVHSAAAHSWVLWHCWARIKDAATVGAGAPLHPDPNSAVLLEGPLGGEAVDMWHGTAAVVVLNGTVAVCVREGGWLARHRTIEKMSAPHRLDTF